MKNAVIIEDERRLRNSLRDLLRLYCPDLELIGMAASCKEAIKILTALSPDLVFLDIKLPDGSGFDILDVLQKQGNKAPSFKVIFTTAYDNFALEAFRVNALDYLLKPIDPQELIAAVEKAGESTNDNNTQKELKEIRELLRTRGNYPTKITVSTSDKLYYLSTDEIIRCESQDNYTTFYLANGERFMVSKTLKEFALQLEGEYFVRVHQSHLINLSYLKSYVKTDGGYLIMKDSSKIPVSQRKKDVLIKRLSNSSSSHSQ